MNAVLSWMFRKAAEFFAELASPKRRPSRGYIRPRLETLEERWCPAAVDLF